MVDAIVVLWIIQLSMLMYALVLGIVSLDYSPSIYGFLSHWEFIIAIIVFSIICLFLWGLLGLVPLSIFTIGLYLYGPLIYYGVSMGSLLRAVCGPWINTLYEWGINIVFYMVSLYGLKRIVKRSSGLLHRMG